MTITNLPPDRPLPDADDLRLLAELINNVAIPLPNAAWNARMSQAEAAARLVSMAERGLPLRLVAEGDRNALWQIAQAGPAAPAAPVPNPPTPAPSPSPPPSAFDAAVAPPHPPAPAPASDAPHGEHESPADLAGYDDDRVASVPAAPGTAEPVAPLPTAEPVAPPPAAAPPAAAPPTPRRWARYPVTGPAGEQLLVTVLEVHDPGDRELAAAGQPVVPGYRSVLVRSHVANVGQVFYPASADANLVLETDRHELLGRSGPLPGTHPGFAIGVAPGQSVDGWSLFVIPIGTALAGLKWCIRPDIPQSILSWPIAP